MATKSNPVGTFGNSFLRQLAKAGVPFAEARWLHLKMLGEGFNTSAELTKVRTILRQMRGAVHGVVCA